MPKFTDRDQAAIEETVAKAVDALESGDQITWTLTPESELTVSNQGVEYTRRGANALWPWPDILKFDVITLVNSLAVRPTYYVELRQQKGKKYRPSVQLEGTSVHDQRLLVVLQHLHERKVGRYLYPRLRETGTGEKFLRGATGLLVAWGDAKQLPEGSPSPIVEGRGGPSTEAAAITRFRFLVVENWEKMTDPAREEATSTLTQVGYGIDANTGRSYRLGHK